jgi:hypothetical protein
MRKLFFTVLFLITVQYFQAQNLGLFTGVNMMSNYPFQETSEHYYTRFSAKPGFSLGLELDDFDIGFTPIKLTVKIAKFNTDISHENSGLGGGYHLDVTQGNYYLSIGTHILKNKPLSPIQLSLGFEYSILLSEKFDGSSRTWSASSGGKTESVDENSFELNMKNIFSITGTIGYKKEVTTGWYIEPQLSIFAGISKELQIFEPIRTLKFLLEFGISRCL